MNELGMFLRKLRIDRNEVLYDMAQRLGVSPAFLSAVENDHRTAPLSWIDTLAAQYDLSPQQKKELSSLIYDSIKQVRLDVSNASEPKRNCALTFARTFDDIPDEEIQEFLDLLNKRMNG